MDERRLEEEYRKMQRQAAPDLWGRIESSLKDHPERMEKGAAGAELEKIAAGTLGETLEETREGTVKETLGGPSGKGLDETREGTVKGTLGEFSGKGRGEIRESGEAGGKIRRLPKRASYRMAAAAAAAVALLVAAPQMLNRWPGYGSADSGAGGMDTAMPEMAVEEELAVAEAVDEDTPDSGSVQNGKVTAGGGAFAGGAADRQMNAAPQAAPRMAVEEDLAPMEIMEVPNYEATEDRNGFLRYDQLQLVSYQPLAVPEDAVTVPEDSRYFSEAIFRDTELLVGGTVTDVTLEYDGDGKAVKVVYEMNLDQVYYAEDYTTGLETLTVKSPIVETEGDEVFILYQLQPGGTYLLPLWQKDGDWELLYPFAPQIQVTGDGGYLFHSGYASLVTGDTSVVLGSQEGENDYYYDRMLLREDGNFLSDFVSLVENQVQGGNQNEKE